MARHGPPHSRLPQVGGGRQSEWRFKGLCAKVPLDRVAEGLKAAKKYREKMRKETVVKDGDDPVLFDILMKLIESAFWDGYRQCLEDEHCIRPRDSKGRFIKAIGKAPQ